MVHLSAESFLNKSKAVSVGSATIFQCLQIISEEIIKSHLDIKGEAGAEIGSEVEAREGLNDER